MANILGVGAHFDDLELGCGGTLARHVADGDRVTMLVVTHSGYSSPDGAVVRDKDVALKEGQAGADVIGAELVSLGAETLAVQFNEKLTAQILAVIEERRIDTIYTHWTQDVHRDHQNVGKSTLMAGRHIPRLLMYRSNLYSAEVPFGGSFYVDISDTWKIKKEAIEAHASELNRVGSKWIEMAQQQASLDGMAIGVAFAECFKAIRFSY